MTSHLVWPVGCHTPSSPAGREEHLTNLSILLYLSDPLTDPFVICHPSSSTAAARVRSTVLSCQYQAGATPNGIRRLGRGRVAGRSVRTVRKRTLHAAYGRHHRVRDTGRATALLPAPLPAQGSRTATGARGAHRRARGATCLLCEHGFQPRLARQEGCLC
jgi:hypothetical protein